MHSKKLDPTKCVLIHCFADFTFPEHSHSHKSIWLFEIGDVLLVLRPLLNRCSFVSKQNLAMYLQITNYATPFL